MAVAWHGNQVIPLQITLYCACFCAVSSRETYVNTGSGGVISVAAAACRRVRALVAVRYALHAATRDTISLIRLQCLTTDRLLRTAMQDPLPSILRLQHAAAFGLWTPSAMHCSTNDIVNMEAHLCLLAAMRLGVFPDRSKQRHIPRPHHTL